MKYVNLGTSDLIVSSITFGAWAIGGWMWGGADKKEAIKAIQKGYDLGITSIDTAAVYGFGESERIVGKAIKGNRDNYQILTKYGMRWNDTKGNYYFSTIGNNGESIDLYRYAAKESIIKECEDSLRRLGTDYIDLYQIHWPDESTPISETMEAIEMLKEKGKVREAGVSNYSVEQLNEADQYTHIVSNQVPYSMLRRDIEKTLVPYTQKHHKSIIAYSPLQRGVLTGKITPGYKFNKGDTRGGLAYFKEDNVVKINDFLNQILPIAIDHGATLTQLVLCWTLAQPGIDVILVGARDEKQISENTGAANIYLSDKEIDLINHYLSKLGSIDRT